MFTVCPKCALTLVVTAADLRVAQGYVRCGRCSSVFNALARLADERQGAGAEAPAPPADFSSSAAAPEELSSSAVSAEPQAAPPQAPETPAPPSMSEDEPIPEEALEFNPAKTDVTSVFVQPEPDPQWTAATGSFKAMVAANQEATEKAVEIEPADQEVEVEIDAAFLASMLKADTPAKPEHAPARPRSGAAAPVPQVPVPEAPAAAPPPGAARIRPTARHSAHARPRQAAVAPPPARVQPVPAAIEDSAEERDELAGEFGARGDPEVREGDTLRRLLPLAWRIGAAVALFGLLVQIVNHYRDELAATARFNRPLTTLYAALGVHLVPRWDLHAYDVRQLGASVDPGGTGLITVRASIKNAAQQPQPLPLLRVTLQDRFGNRIASSEVAPRFYLPHAVPASSFLSAGQRIDAQMGFMDPGASAVGFELDACLPARGGGVACANDASTR
jgi:predicted Zn finger-like uncharacterized protein